MLLLQRAQCIFADDDENIEAVHRLARGGFVESLHAAKSQCGNDLFRFLFDVGGIVARALYVYDGRGGEASCNRIRIKCVGVIVFGEACCYEFCLSGACQSVCAASVANGDGVRALMFGGFRGIVLVGFLVGGFIGVVLFCRSGFFVSTG